MSCRYYCIDSHRNILETFLSIKNFIKHFAGIFTRSFAIKKLSFANGGQWERGLEKARSNLFYVDCHANARNDGESKSRNDKCNDEKNIVITRFCKNRSNPQKRNFINFGLLRFTRNDKCNYKSFCNDKNFQFDKYWRLFFKNELFFNELFSVIYKKNLLSMEVLFMRKQSTKTRLMILATALLLAWVGISCKSNNRPTGDDNNLDLVIPGGNTNIVTPIDNAGGLLNDNELGNWNDAMIQIRLLAVSDDGGYKRNPAIATFGDLSGKKYKFITVIEKRFGDSGLGDVGIDGKATTELIYQFSGDSGNTISGEATIGQSAANDPTLSRGAPVIFPGSDGSTVGIVAAAGGGMYGNSKIKIIKGTAGADTAAGITWNSDGEEGGWKDLTLTEEAKNKINNRDAKNDANADILAYIRQVMGDSGFNAFYLRSGVGGVSGDTWVLGVVALKINYGTYQYFGLLTLYSEDKGETWNFGPYAKMQDSGRSRGGERLSDYREGQVAAFDGSTVTLVACPMTFDNGYTSRNMFVFTGPYNQDVELTKTESPIVDATSGFGLAQDTKNSKYYFINVRKRVDMGAARILTIAETTKDLTSAGVEMKLTGVSGVGSVAVLGDGSLVTIAEEAHAEGSSASQTKFNIVQRRFTQGYINARASDNNGKVLKDEEYYNTRYSIDDLE